MPNFLRDVAVKNVVLTDDAIQELNRIVQGRIAAHNSSTPDPDRQLGLNYIVRFDSRGYRTSSQNEAWEYYVGAKKLERVVFESQSLLAIRTNNNAGEQIMIRLDTVAETTSHIIVGGESKDWVEATFTELQSTLERYKSNTTAIARSEFVKLLIQLLGIGVGVLLCLWLATLTAPYIKDVDYPRAIAFGLWFLVYSNLWTYLQLQAAVFLTHLFPSVRFSRKGTHWIERLVRKGVEGIAIALGLYLLGLFSQWALSVLAPYFLIAQ